MFSGFPWNLSGMAWTDNLAILQSLSIGGIYFLSALTIFMFSAPAFVVKGDSSKWLRGSVGILALVCFATLYLYGFHRLQQNPTTYNKDIVVQIIQPNISQADKWNAEKKWDSYRTLMSLVEQNQNFPSAKTRVVVMPETSLTYHDIQTPQAMDSLRGRLKSYPEKNVYLLSGALLRDDAGYHNSLIVMDKNADFLESFDKFHLVPFGEYIPLQSYIPLPTVTQFSGFVSGAGPLTLSQPGLPAFSPLVCYEVIFPNAVVNRNGERPAWMVNVTNDAWYGISPGPFQHMAQARYRAIEEGLPIVRAANTGISVVIDAYGRIVAGANLNQESNFETLLPAPASETVYAKLH
jgi:apolipoprotein N-acyltransferase